MVTEKPNNVIPIRVSEAENFAETAQRYLEQFGERITGCFIMLRLDEHGPTIQIHKSWPSMAELIGHLNVQIVRTIDSHFADDDGLAQ